MEEHRPEGSSSSSSSSSGRPLKVTFSGPGKHWTDAAPIGNGRIGAMVWGGVASELIQLNEDTLWTGTPGNYTNPNAPAALLEVRKLVDSGDFAEATAAAQKLTGNPSEVYQLLGDLKLEFDDWHLGYDKETYCRELDLDTATVRLKYSVGEVKFAREYFASFPDQVFVTRLSASKSGALSFTVSLDSKLHHHSFVNGDNRIVMEGTCPSERLPPEMNESESDRPKGIQFCTVLDLQISEGKGVRSIIDENKLRVEGADWVVLLLVASSSFDGPLTMPSDSKKDPNVDCQHALKSVRNFSYIELYARHLDDYQNLFGRVSLQLFKEIAKSGNEQLLSSTAETFFKRDLDGEISTAERVRSFEHDEDPSMVELLFQFGRYLLISCSRPGSQVANLQGIWNKDSAPAWDGTPHLNINLEMNYWPSLPCNLAECQEPLFDFIASLSINGTKTAKVNYGASGWVVHHKTDVWAKSSPVDGDVVWAFWPMGGAWLCTHLWEHYMYSLDKEFLKVKAYPLIEGCASFLLDWLIDGRDGYLETNPSTSPEHEFIAPDGKLASVSYSSTMDMAIIREVFSAVEDAAEILGTSNSVLVNKVREAHKRLNPTKIARDGSIMEWAQDFEDPEVHHRHMSHLYGLFPGHTLTIEQTPKLCKAAENTLYKRGVEGPGWSTAWKTALWARLHKSDHAYRMVKNLFQLVDPDEGIAFKGGLYSNLFAAHPPFQIDANLGFSAAVAEMLVQSSLADLYLLPALPRDKWGSGQVKGLKARGGVTVDMQWQEGDLREAHIQSNCSDGAPLILRRRLHYKGFTVTINIEQGRVHAFDGELRQLSSF